MGRTLYAFLERGLDLQLAKELIAKGYNLSYLKRKSQEELRLLDLSDVQISLLHAEPRPSIPENIVTSLLYKSRRTCCICRISERSIVIHHIDSWKNSRSHDEENLVVLCLEHHDLAHTKKELSLNLTGQQIRSAKESWIKEVERLDTIRLAQEFKELNVIPIQLSQLKERWFQFFRKLGWKIQMITDPFDKLRYDFQLAGKRLLSFKVYEIEDIEELVNKELLIKEYDNESFFDDIIVLGKEPFLSNKGFYSNETNIQIGWMFSHGEGGWDHVMLKGGYDISNSIFHVENMIYDITSYKNFLTEDSWNEIESYWLE